MTPHRMIVLMALLGGCAAPDGPADFAVSGSVTATEAGRLTFGPESARRVALTDGLAFVACGAGGVRVVDVTDPTAPEVLAAIRDVRADAIAFAEDQLFVLGVEEGLFSDVGTLTVIDLVDPRVPGVRRTVALDVEGVPALSAEAGVVAVAAGREGVHTVSGRGQRLSDLTGPLDASRAEAALARRGAIWVLGRTTRPGWFGLFGDDDVLVLLGRSEDERTTRLEWTEAGLEQRTADLEVTGDVLLVATGRELRIVGVRDFERPEPLGALPLAGASAVAASGTIGAVVAAGDVVLLDLDRPESPLPASTLDLDGSAADVALQDGLLAIADGADGLRLYFVDRAGG